MEGWRIMLGGSAPATVGIAAFIAADIMTESEANAVMEKLKYEPVPELPSTCYKQIMETLKTVRLEQDGFRSKK